MLGGMKLLCLALALLVGTSAAWTDNRYDYVGHSKFALTKDMLDNLTRVSHHMDETVNDVDNSNLATWLKDIDVTDEWAVSTTTAIKHMLTNSELTSQKWVFRFETEEDSKMTMNTVVCRATKTGGDIKIVADHELFTLLIPKVSRWHMYELGSRKYRATGPREKHWTPVPRSLNADEIVLAKDTLMNYVSETHQHAIDG